jgi:hypothetical protein
MMVAICSSETSVLTRATRRHIPKDGILHSHRCENLKSNTAHFMGAITILLCISYEAIFFYLFSWSGTELTILRPFIGLLYQAWMIDGDDCGAISGMTAWQGKPQYSEKTCPSATFSTTNPTRLDPGSNLGRRGGMPATNRLSDATAITYNYCVLYLGAYSVSCNSSSTQLLRIWQQ